VRPPPPPPAAVTPTIPGEPAADAIDAWQGAMTALAAGMPTGDALAEPALAEAAVGGMKVVGVAMEALASAALSDHLAALYCSSADQLVSLLTRHATVAFDAAVASPPSAPASRICRHALTALMHVFSAPQAARAVSEPTLRGCAGELLTRLLDEHLGGVADGGDLVRSLNLLMLKLLENGTRTAGFVALLVLLRTPPPRVAAAAAPLRVSFNDLVVKCLIKLTRTLAQSTAELEASEVLLAIHLFFLSLGVDELRRRAAEDDRPLRIVKTLLYELTKALGPAIRGHLGKVPPATFTPPPIIHAYIQFNLDSLAAPGGSPRSEASSGGMLAAQGSLSGDDALKAQLAAIFKRVGDKADSAAGIEALYEFRLANPKVDLEPHLVRASDAFRMYITRGLAKLEAARAVAAQPLPSAPAPAAEAYAERLQRMKAAQSAGAAPADLAAAGSRQNLDALRERMKAIAARAMAEAPATDPGAAGGGSSAEAERVVAAPPPTQLEQLQARMARIREEKLRAASG